MEGGKLSYLGYILTIAINVLTTWIVLSAFELVYDNFEIIILSIVILIYLSIKSFANGWELQKQQEVITFNESFRRIRNLLKEKVDEYSKEYEYVSIEKSKNKLEQEKIKFYINIGFSLLIHIIVLLELFSVLT